MSYQNVQVPKFFVDTITWLTSLGVDSGIGGDREGKMSFNGVQQWGIDGTNIFSNPSKKNIITFSQLPQDIGTSSEFHVYTNSQLVNFIFLLGTNYTLNEFDSSLYAYQNTSGYPSWGGVTIGSDPGVTSSFNQEIATAFANTYQGWSLIEFPEISPFSIVLSIYIKEFMPDLQLNAIVVGKSYTMENAANLSLSMSREYGGIKETTSYNGSTFTNQMNSSVPKWGELGAWELGTPNTIAYQKLAKSGRRVWSLSFSYMDQKNLWGSNQHLGTSEWGSQDATIYGDDLDNDGNFKYNILTENSFFASVWNKTLGPTLKFVFFPDKDNLNPDQPAICRFRDDLKATRSSPSTWDISVTIEEVW